MRILAILLLALPAVAPGCFGDDAPAPPRVHLSSGFPLGKVTIHEPTRETVDLDGKMVEEYRSPLLVVNTSRGVMRAYGTMEFNATGFGVSTFAPTDEGGVTYRMAFAHADCEARVLQEGAKPRIVHGKLEGTLTAGAPPISVFVWAPCKADFTISAQ